VGEDEFEMAFEEGAGVLEISFRVGFGGGDGCEGFVEDADDTLLLGDRGDVKVKIQDGVHVCSRHTSTR
jgi:hypothetical protein